MLALCLSQFSTIAFLIIPIFTSKRGCYFPNSSKVKLAFFESILKTLSSLPFFFNYNIENITFMKNKLNFLIFLAFIILGGASCEKDSIESDKTTDVEEITNINWKNWYLSIPIDNGEGKATSIFYEDIINDNLTEEASQYFYRNDDGSYTMYTKYTGYTTSGTYDLNKGRFCRTELRELWQGSSDLLDNWLMSEGTHVLETTVQIEECTEVYDFCRTIVAQIHAKETPGLEGSPPTVIIQWRNGELGVDYYQKPTTPGINWGKENKLFGQHPQNVGKEKFTVQLKVENGKLYYGVVCEANNINTGYIEVYDYVGNGYAYENYFKTGNYFTYNGDYITDAQVRLFEVKTEHK